MRAKLIVDDKEFDIEILDQKAKDLVAQSKCNTGYERVGTTSLYWFIGDGGKIFSGLDYNDVLDADRYDGANYYSDRVVAENNARADKLMRQLRRLSVKHREFEDEDSKKFKDERWVIVYDYTMGELFTQQIEDCNVFAAHWFNSERAANVAIRDFRKELEWYFTEYKDIM